MAKYFDLRKAEKKTSGILADWLKKIKKKKERDKKVRERSGGKKKILQRTRPGFLNSCKMFFLEDQRSMLEKCWNGPSSL